VEKDRPKKLGQTVAIAINSHDIVNGATFLFHTEYPSAAPRWYDISVDIERAYVLKSVTPTPLLRRSRATSSLWKGIMVSRPGTHPKRAYGISHLDGCYHVSAMYCAFP
jgi:hypothetical protein